MIEHKIQWNGEDPLAGEFLHKLTQMAFNDKLSIRINFEENGKYYKVRFTYLDGRFYEHNLYPTNWIVFRNEIDPLTDGDFNVFTVYTDKQLKELENNE